MNTGTDFEISTDRVILNYIKKKPDGEAIVFTSPLDPLFPMQQGIVTSCCVRTRTVTIQNENGKNTYKFDWILIPKEKS